MLSLITIFLNFKKYKFDNEYMKNIIISSKCGKKQIQNNLITLNKCEIKKVGFKQIIS
jgi:hypothetical protein